MAIDWSIPLLRLFALPANLPDKVEQLEAEGMSFPYHKRFPRRGQPGYSFHLREAQRVLTNTDTFAFLLILAATDKPVTVASLARGYDVVSALRDTSMKKNPDSFRKKLEVTLIPYLEDYYGFVRTLEVGERDVHHDGKRKARSGQRAIQATERAHELLEKVEEKVSEEADRLSGALKRIHDNQKE